MSSIFSQKFKWSIFWDSLSLRTFFLSHLWMNHSFSLFRNLELQFFILKAYADVVPLCEAFMKRRNVWQICFSSFCLLPSGLCAIVHNIIFKCWFFITRRLDVILFPLIYFVGIWWVLIRTHFCFMSGKFSSIVSYYYFSICSIIFLSVIPCHVCLYSHTEMNYLYTILALFSSPFNWKKKNGEYRGIVVFIVSDFLVVGLKVM